VGAGLCGSELARDCSGSANQSVADTPLSRASPLPHGIYGGLYIETKKKLAINAMPTNHTSERKIAQSAR